METQYWLQPVSVLGRTEHKNYSQGFGTNETSPPLIEICFLAKFLNKVQSVKLCFYFPLATCRCPTQPCPSGCTGFLENSLGSHGDVVSFTTSLVYFHFPASIVLLFHPTVSPFFLLLSTVETRARVQVGSCSQQTLSSYSQFHRRVLYYV